jgi:hypothetical protein
MVAGDDQYLNSGILDQPAVLGKQFVVDTLSVFGEVSRYQNEIGRILFHRAQSGSKDRLTLPKQFPVFGEIRPERFSFHTERNIVEVGITEHQEPYNFIVYRSTTD